MQRALLETRSMALDKRMEYYIVPKWALYWATARALDSKAKRQG